ncbi:fascin domain-containing protein [Micromonospora zamorensis]|uniref:fascin domain-containing protein n=1 Tax=Micromonospora zamorensis TaxID=709883 RepID=UPI0033EAB4A8
MFKRRSARLLVALIAVIAPVVAGTPALAQDTTFNPAAGGATSDRVAASTPAILTPGCGYLIYSFAVQKFVSANLSQSDYPLQASATDAGPWERFCLVKVSGLNGDWAILSQANNKYVSARADLPNHPLQARAQNVGSFEKFYIRQLISGQYSFLSGAGGDFVSARADLPTYPLHARGAEEGAWERFYIGLN